MRKMEVIQIDRNFEEIIISAERYACGRMSYIVGFTCNYIGKLLPRLSDWCLKTMRNDLKTEFEMHERIGKLVGMQCDHENWKQLYERIEEELKRRNEEQTEQGGNL